jgi:lysozyme family protein
MLGAVMIPGNLTSTPRLLGAPLALAVALFAGVQHSGSTREIIGTWRGSAVCANRARDLTCRNETVIYDVDTIGATRGTVMLRAHRMVNRDRQFMYAMQFKYLPGSRTWQSDFTSSTFHGRWEYTINGGVMTGRLIEVPSKRLVRRVTVRRSAPLRRGG